MWGVLEVGVEGVGAELKLVGERVATSSAQTAGPPLGLTAPVDCMHRQM